MIKSPEEIKKGLDCCGVKSCCTGCPYSPEPDGADAGQCISVLMTDAADLIAQAIDKIRAELGGAQE